MKTELLKDQRDQKWNTVCLQVLAAAVVARRALLKERDSHQALEKAQSLLRAVKTLCRVSVCTAFALLSLLDGDTVLKSAHNAQNPSGMKCVCTNLASQCAGHF